MSTWNGQYLNRIANETNFAPAEAQVFIRWKKAKTSRGDNGLFIEQSSRMSEILMIDGGTVVDSVADVPDDFRYAVLLNETLFLAPPNPFDLGPTWLINHSCDPTIKRIGGLVYVARKDLHPEMELTLDYASLIAGVPGWEMPCSCGSAICREKITSDDWRDPEIAAALWPEWLPHIQKKILETGILG